MRRLVLIVLLLCGCSPSMRSTEPPPNLVWVARAYTGGVQCQATIRYRPPNTVEVLRRAGVVAYAITQEGLPVCEACDCPGYSQMHYGLIAETNIPRAARAGFQPRTPPAYLLPESLRPQARVEPK